MSIENDLKRMADANEVIAAKLTVLCEHMVHIGRAVEGVKCGQGQPGTDDTTSAQAPAPVAPVAGTVEQPATNTVPTPPVAVPPAPTAADAASTPSQPAAPAPIATPVTAAPQITTPEQLNTALVEEFKRLGSREPIDAVMKAEPFAVNGISDLAVEQYDALVAAIKAIPA